VPTVYLPVIVVLILNKYLAGYFMPKQWLGYNKGLAFISQNKQMILLHLAQHDSQAHMVNVITSR
jgi:hypothetical protein